jgi:hypothetical protein
MTEVGTTRTSHDDNWSSCEIWSGSRWRMWHAVSGQGHREEAERMSNWMRDCLASGQVTMEEDDE